MSKNYSSRVSKYAKYRQQIAKMPLVENDSLTATLPASTVEEARLNKINTTTSLDAEAILSEIEKREDPTGQVKKDRERSLKMQKIVHYGTLILFSVIITTILVVLVIFLYRRLS